MTEKFSEVLREENIEEWHKTINHRFSKELFDGTIADGVMAGYLVQDYRFQDGFIALLGAAIVSADDPQARLRFARFVGEVAGDEHTYFVKSFEAFHLSAADREAIPDTSATASFKKIFKEATDTRNYAAVLGVLLVTEWIYKDWAAQAPVPAERPQSFIYTEWIELHEYQGFLDIVKFLRSEMDRVGVADQAMARKYFKTTVDAEVDFFNSSYAAPIEGIER
ncbi:TenA family protein [Eupransor demetentiae]|uniref:Aminopyrimidine aminohydrolase n=1 Tax=Eupransor demetentiae TaxID=3109584 RepID=A0ABM9N5G6_9LACO|nr:Aminopyrimidine aminohydrolase TenA (thiamine salvage pathway) (TenA) [Lactobacillaceae bacterium LMG 33000]